MRVLCVCVMLQERLHKEWEALVGVARRHIVTRLAVTDAMRCTVYRVSRIHAMDALVQLLLS
jgi:hypothetical protein